MMSTNVLRLRHAATADLSPRDITAIRALLSSAFADDGDGFSEDDWAHALGGTHVMLERDAEIIGHASIVERLLHVGDQPLETGYVEAVAIQAPEQGKGFGSRLLADVGDVIQDRYALGALSTGRPSFYERLGWRRWTGPTAVRTERGIVRTPDDDGGILVLLTPATQRLDLSAPICCECRSGDVW